MLDMAQTRQDWFSEVLPVNVTGAMSEAAVEQQRLEYTGSYLSLSWRAPMREPEPERVPIGIPMPQLTWDQFMDLEDDWSMREERV
jgi:hypothetical protein